MSQYLRRLLENSPELVRRKIYFCPTTKISVECLINEDFTVSTACNPSLKFDAAFKLALAIMERRIGDSTTFGLPPNKRPEYYTFGNDFFLQPGRKNLINSSLTENSSSSKHQPHSPTSSTVGIPVVDSAVIDNVGGRLDSCKGLEERKYADIIEYKQWKGDRQEFSPIRYGDGHIWSNKCNNRVRAKQLLCDDCRKCKNQLVRMRWRLKNQRPTEESRLLKSKKSWLTVEDKERKMQILLERKTAAIRKLRTEKKKLAKCENELVKYRPRNVENRKPVENLVGHLDRQVDTTKASRCLWKVGDEVCNALLSSWNGLQNHVRNVHLQQQDDENRNVPMFEQRYICMWDGCKRRAPFNKLKYLRRHLIAYYHLGNRRLENRAAVLREQMENSNRSPSRRRYLAAKSAILAKYKSRKSYERMSAANPLPMPSLGLVLKWKNAGTIDSGVDEHVLQVMAEIGGNRPNMRHGILTFDEIYVNSQAVVNVKSLQVFGYADNKESTLAKTVLVFSYVPLFTRRRKAIPVAWYGAQGLDSRILDYWLWEVALGLYRFGFIVHALVYDGAACNRKLHKRLASETGIRNTRCPSYVIDYPWVPNTGFKLFFISDPSHALKKLRNCWCNRDMDYIDETGRRHDIDWKIIEEVYKWQQQCEKRVDRRLTDRHVVLSNYDKMNTQLAIDVMSESVENVMEILYRSDITQGCRAFMKLAREMWLAINSRQSFFNEVDAAPILSKLEWVGKEFRSWNSQITAEERRDGKFLTSETYDDVLLICDGVPAFASYIFKHLAPKVRGASFKPKVLSQDPLEKTFGMLRDCGGGTQHITVRSIAYSLRGLANNALSALK